MPCNLSISAHIRLTIRALSGRSRLRSAPFVLYRLTLFSQSGHCLRTSGSLSCCFRVAICSLVKRFSYSSHIGLQSGHCLLTSGSLSCCCRVTIGSLVKTCFYTRLEPILQQIFTYFCRLTVGSSIGSGVNETLVMTEMSHFGRKRESSPSWGVWGLRPAPTSPSPGATWLVVRHGEMRARSKHEMRHGEI